MTGLHDIEARTIDGKTRELAEFSGKTLLIVNVASKCGFTPQGVAAGLEALYREFKDRGLVVLGFPCDQFGHQEPGDEAEIAAFCSRDYGVTFFGPLRTAPVLLGGDHRFAQSVALRRIIGIAKNMAGMILCAFAGIQASSNPKARAMISMGCSGSLTLAKLPSLAAIALTFSTMCKAASGQSETIWPRFFSCAWRNTGRPIFCAELCVSFITPKVPPWPEQRSIICSGVSGMSFNISIAFGPIAWARACQRIYCP